MSELQKLYIDAGKKTIGDSLVLPRMVTIKASIFAVCAHICQNIDYLDSKRFAFLIENLPSPLKLHNARTVYLSNHDPRIDKRLQHLRTLFPGDKYSTQTYLPSSYHNAMIGHYNSLLNQYPILKARLEKKFNQKYGMSYSKEIQAIREKKCQALYYFFQDEQDKKSDEFKEIHDLFKKQQTLEHTFAIGLPHFSRYNQNPEKFSISYNLDERALQLCSTIQNNKLSFMLPEDIVETIYPLQESPVKYSFSFDLNRKSHFYPALIGGAPSAKVQLKQLHTQKRDGKNIRPEDIEERELYHLRHSTDSQIFLTLEYFLKHPDKLSRRDMQVYCEANLFQPGLLVDLFNNQANEPFWELLEKFVNEGIEHSQKNEFLSDQSLFYVRLLQAVCTYAFEHSQKDNSTKMTHLITRLNLWTKEPQHPQQLAELHVSRFLALNAMFQAGAAMSEESMLHMLESYFILQTHPLPEAFHQPDASYRLKRNLRAFMYRVKKQSDKLPCQDLLNILSEHQLLPKAIQWEAEPLFSFPSIIIKGKDGHQYTVNLQQGLILKDKLILVHTPLALLQQPIVRQLGMTDVRQCYQSANQKQFFLEKDGLQLRFTKHDSVYFVEQQFQSATGLPEWYELISFNFTQNQFLNLDEKKRLFECNLPELLQQRKTFIWKHPSNPNELLITDAANQILYRLENKGMSAFGWQVVSADNNAVLYHSLSETEDKFSAIESPKFMLISKDSNGSIECELPRYQLRFCKPATSSRYQWHWDGTEQYLDEAQPLQKQGLPALTFSKQSLCVLPVTRLVATGKRQKDGEYYQLEADLENNIAADIVNRKPNDGSAAFTKPQIWQYSNSAKTMILKMKNGEPYPETSAQALYLCYLYLGTHQKEKALTMLEACDKRLGGLAGSYEELQYLQWICEASPYMPKDSKKAEKAQRSTPTLIACRLKAIGLWAELGQRGQQIVYPQTDPDPKTPEAFCHRETVKAVRKFHQNGLSEMIYNYYSRYQLMRRDMPVSFLLSESESRCLLNYYHDGLPASAEEEKEPKAIGALGYDWLRLNLLNLKRELDRIEEKAKTNRLSPYELKRKNTIETYIKNHQGVYRIQSRLSKVNLNLSIQEHEGLYYCIEACAAFKKIFPEKISERRLGSIEEKITKAMAVLNPGIGEKTFAKNFGYYVAVALKNNAQARELKSFCVAYLRASRHVPIDQQPNDIPYLCNLLYRVACKCESGKLVHTDFRSVYAFLRIVKDDPPSIHIYQLKDTTHELPQSTESVHHSIPEDKPADIPKVNPKQQRQISALKLFQKEIGSGLMTSATKWQELETGFYHIEESEYDSDSEDEYEKEHSAGKHKYQLLEKMRMHARDLFPGRDRILELGKETTERLKILEREQRSFETKKTIKTGQRGPGIARWKSFLGY